MRFIRDRIRTFVADERGASSAEYPIAFVAVFGVFMFAFQVAFAMFELISTEKAAQTGARFASVRAPISNNVPSQNGVASGGTAGDWCTNGQCVAQPNSPWTCNGATLAADNCDVEAFKKLWDDMARQGFNYDPGDITISYQYAWLGYAGGPFVPLIEVQIESQPFLFSFGLGDDLTRRRVIGNAIGEDMTTVYAGINGGDGGAGGAGAGGGGGGGGGGEGDPDPEICYNNGGNPVACP